MTRSSISWMLLLSICAAGCSSQGDERGSDLPVDEPVIVDNDVSIPSEDALLRVSPCDPEEEDGSSPLSFDAVSDWWLLTAADDGVLESLETREGLDGAGSAVVRLTATGLSGTRAADASVLNEAIVGIWDAAAFRVGLEYGADVFFGTDEFDLVRLSMVRFDDGTTMFGGGYCATQSILRQLSGIHGEELDTVLDTMPTVVGKQLTAFALR